MENFEFKSPICTSIEQSKRLLELGLKKETADCYLFEYDKGKYKVIAESWLDLIADKKYYSQYKDVCFPAWSLARLFEISNSAIHIGLPAITDRQQPYDYLIATINYIKRDCFNKDYLEENNESKS